MLVVTTAAPLQKQYQLDHVNVSITVQDILHTSLPILM